jgi:hypothetical protein
VSVPGGESFNRLRDFWRQGREFGLDPLLEAGEVGVAVRQRTAVDEERPQVLDGESWRQLVETLVGDRDFAGVQLCEQCTDLGGLLPGEDACRPTG